MASLSRPAPLRTAFFAVPGSQWYQVPQKPRQERKMRAPAKMGRIGFTGQAGRVGAVEPERVVEQRATDAKVACQPGEQGVRALIFAGRSHARKQPSDFPVGAVGDLADRAFGLQPAFCQQGRKFVPQIAVLSLYCRG